LSLHSMFEAHKKCQVIIIIIIIMMHTVSKRKREANNESSEVCGHLLPVTYLI